MRDLVNYLVYMGEPAQLQRHRIGYMVLTFLFAVMLPLEIPEKEFGKTFINFFWSKKANLFQVCLFLFNQFMSD